jgi:NAD(P)-dependent dehydrogenase (short-subunit alcohol dehydrogenase family)
MSHSDFTAIVTGAASTRGIGRGTALALAADGWNVAILDSTRPAPRRPPTRSPSAAACRPSASAATSPTRTPSKRP